MVLHLTDCGREEKDRGRCGRNKSQDHVHIHRLEILPAQGKVRKFEISSAVETTNSTAAIEVTYHTLRTVNYWLIESIAMSSDEIVWQVINQQFCSFKLK